MTSMHQSCKCFTTLVLANFLTYSLRESFSVLATNTDDNGIDYISATEHVRYPFYTVQFHPEKNQFTFSKSNIPHESGAIDLTLHLAERLIKDAALSSNRFDSYEQYISYSIENNAVDVLSITALTEEYRFLHDYP